MSTWSCPHQTHDFHCRRVKDACRPGRKGCVLRGKVAFDEGPALRHRWDDLEGETQPPADPLKGNNKKH